MDKQTDVYIQNRKARYNYHFIDEYEAGVQLLGSEVKSIKAGRVSMADCFCYFDNSELLIKGLNITPIDENYVHEPLRVRKLLLHRKELNKLEKGLTTGITIVVTCIKSVKGKIKFKIALAHGKKDWDKRETIKAREADRQIKENC
jgi:SsrA-binding protein